MSNSTVAFRFTFKSTSMSRWPLLNATMCLVRLRPALGTDERHELDVAEVILVVDDRIATREPDQPLQMRAAGRHDEPAADRELIEERARRRRRTGGDRDRVVGRVRRPAERAVTLVDADVREAEAGEPLGGGARELGDPLDGLDLGGERAEDRGRVPRAGADIEHPLVTA